MMAFFLSCWQLVFVESASSGCLGTAYQIREVDKTKCLGFGPVCLDHTFVGILKMFFLGFICKNLLKSGWSTILSSVRGTFD